MNKTVKTSSFLDNWGIGISFMCSLHCAAMPLVFLTPLWAGLNTSWLEQGELWLFVVAALVGTVSIGHTYSKCKDVMPGVLLLMGLSFVVAGSAFEAIWTESVFRVLGSLLLIGAHVSNKRVQKSVGQ